MRHACHAESTVPDVREPDVEGLIGHVSLQRPTFEDPMHHGVHVFHHMMVRSMADDDGDALRKGFHSDNAVRCRMLVSGITSNGSTPLLFKATRTESLSHLPVVMLCQTVYVTASATCS